MKITRHYCPECDKVGVSIYHGPNHALHLVLTIFTYGLWIPVWVTRPRIHRCRECGTITKSEKRPWLETRLDKAFFYGSLTLIVVALAVGAWLVFR